MAPNLSQIVLKLHRQASRLEKFSLLLSCSCPWRLNSLSTEEWTKFCFNACHKSWEVSNPKTKYNISLLKVLVIQPFKSLSNLCHWVNSGLSISRWWVRKGNQHRSRWHNNSTIDEWTKPMRINKVQQLVFPQQVHKIRDIRMIWVGKMHCKSGWRWWFNHDQKW